MGQWFSHRRHQLLTLSTKDKYILVMSSQAAVKRIRALHRKKGRMESGRAIAQGSKLVQELLDSEQEVVEIHMLESCTRILAGYEEDLMHIASSSQLAQMSTLQTGTDAIAVFEKPDYGELVPEEGEVYLACDAIADPGNLGTIVRSADCFGVTGVICGHDTVDPFNPKSVQAAMGSLFRVPVFELDLSLLNEMNVAIYTAEMDGTSLYQQEIQTPAVIVLGNESHGVTERFGSAKTITIPNTGSADSLNVSMAATVIVSELYRREL